MNKQEAKQMIATIFKEKEVNEHRISEIITRNDQLECAIKNLEGWLANNQTSISLQADHDDLANKLQALEDSATFHPHKPPKRKKRKLSKKGAANIRKAQKERWAAFKALGKAPLQKSKLAKKQKGKHWTQRPENRKKMMAHIIEMRKAA